MVPQAHVTHWRNNYAPWPRDEQVEQDLVLSRVLVELFDEPAIADNLAFRGGTALHKLHLAPAVRYSEDIDLVQTTPRPIGSLLSVLRARLDWLGSAQYDPGENMFTLVYRFDTHTVPAIRMRLKLEIYTREAFTTHGVIDVPFGVDSRWFDGATMLRTYRLEELLGTKLRALYQRRKGRDAFDLAHALDREPQLERQTVVDCFAAYMAREGALPKRAVFERNLDGKQANGVFMTDMNSLLHPQYGHYDPAKALDRIRTEFLSLLA